MSCKIFPLPPSLNPQDMCNGEEGSFRVLVENEACGIVGRRCRKAVTILFQGGWIVMQDGVVIQHNIIFLWIYVMYGGQECQHDIFDMSICKTLQMKLKLSRKKSKQMKL